MVVIIFGVSGAGKTTVGKLLAKQLRWRFIEADDFHPPSNLEKMRHNVPLTDEDRWPWLEKLRQQIEAALNSDENAVLACSALKRKYRDCLQVSPKVRLVFLRGSRERIAKQMAGRHRHFMPADLLDSQFADLEEPTPDENAIVIELGQSPDEIVGKIRNRLRVDQT